MPEPVIRLQEAGFDPGAETNIFLAASAGAGAAVSFTGLVRSLPDHPIDGLTLEAYPGLAESQMRKIGGDAIARFELGALTIIHRFGTMVPGEPIVQVMALSAHRQAAFDGAGFVMDWLKTDAPFWKKEARPDGAQWVEAASKDDAARDRWKS